MASRDPLSDSIILWTRVAPTIENDDSNITVEGNVPLYDHDSKSYVSADPNLVCVEYRIGTDKKFSKVVDVGKANTTSSIDYRVKVRVNYLIVQTRNPISCFIYRSVLRVESIILTTTRSKRRI